MRKFLLLGCVCQGNPGSGRDLTLESPAGGFSLKGPTYG